MHAEPLSHRDAVRRARKPYARNFKAKDAGGLGRVRLNYCEWCGNRTRHNIPYASPLTPQVHEQLCAECHRAARLLDDLTEQGA